MSIAILAEDGFQHEDLAYTRGLFEEAGVGVQIVSSRFPEVVALDTSGRIMKIRSDVVADSPTTDYFGIFIPDGIDHIEKLLCNPHCIAILQASYYGRKTIAACGRGTLPLLQSGIMNGRGVSVPDFLKHEARGAGVSVNDAPVTVDGPFITCKNSAYLPLLVTSFIDNLKARFTRRATSQASGS